MGFAKVAKILRFVLLPFVVLYLFIAVLYGAVLVNPELGIELGVYNEEVTPENFSSVAITNIFMCIVFLAADIVFFVIYARYKANLRREQEQSYKSKLSSKRKLKIAFRIIGIILLAAGLLVSIGYRPYGSILILLGIPFFVLSFIIRTRKHVGSKNITRRVEGNKLYVTFKEDDLTSKLSVSNKLCKIIQDVINDGYYQLEMFDSSTGSNTVNMIFSTPLSNDEIKAQYQRREKYYNSKGANAHEMPWYFSDEITIMYYSNVTRQDSYTKRVPIYNDQYEVTKNSAGVEISRKKVNSLYSHDEIWTYSVTYTEYRFYYKNGSPFTTINGNQVVIYGKDEYVVDKRKA